VDKQLVSLGTAVCPVCGTEHTESVVMQMRGITHPKLPRKMHTGFELCPEHKKLHEDGYLALVVVTSVPEGVPLVEQYNGAERTGEILHMRYSVAADIFNVPLGEMPMTWIDPQAAEMIKGMMPKEG
jgi:hypothetical protein